MPAVSYVGGIQWYFLFHALRRMIQPFCLWGCGIDTDRLEGLLSERETRKGIDLWVCMENRGGCSCVVGKPEGIFLSGKY